MITEIKIENFKSLHDLTLDVGRFNILIGENGSGKSNILEAITLAAAAEANKLDNEFLSSRGIRVTDPHFMRSAFSDQSKNLPIKITVNDIAENISNEYLLTNDNKPYSKWTFDKSMNDINNTETDSSETSKNTKTTNTFIAFIKSQTSKKISKIKNNEQRSKFEKALENTNDSSEKIFLLSIEVEEYFWSENPQLLKYTDWKHETEDKIGLENFVIYSPENTALRNLYKEGQIEPLGVNGEGLLKLLKIIDGSSEPESLSKIGDLHEALKLFDWYQEIKIPNDLSESEDKVKITDKYLQETFDQRSTNEGFLFVLFYIALMVSDDTPKIFAIDNIDASLNPKLCSKLITELIRLAKKYDKQVFVTTHNPAILDGIDLGDDEQRLLVVSRNKQGHTRYKRIHLEDKPKSSSGEPVKLSEAFLRGYLGGLPKGF